MPPQTGKSALLAKLGSRGAQAHAKFKDAPSQHSDFSGNVPPRVENGVGEIKECEFRLIPPGKDNAGEYQFYIAGVALSPDSVTDKNGNVLPVQGKRFSVFEPMFDTPTRSRKTVEEHYWWVLELFGMLGVDTSAVKFENLEATAAALKKAKVTCEFRSWQGQVATEGKYKDRVPLTNYVIGKACERPAISADVQDGSGVTAGEPSTNGDVQYSDDQDLDSLLTAATNGDEAASDKLKEMALAAGMSEADYDSKGWGEVGEFLKNPPAADAAPAADWEPKKTEVYFFKPFDTKTKKPGKKSVECQIVSVDKKNKTVKVTRLDTKVEVSGVKWDDLTGEE